MGKEERQLLQDILKAIKGRVPGAPEEVIRLYASEIRIETLGRFEVVLKNHFSPGQTPQEFGDLSREIRSESD